MKAGQLKSTTLQQLKKFKVTRKFWVYLSCLIISALFWLLTTLSKDYSTILYFPVEYVNLPEDKIVITPLPNHLGVEINSFGFNLLWHKLQGGLSPIEFDADIENMKNHGKENSYFIATSTKLAEISSQLDHELKVVSVNPDTIFFRFSQKAFKTVPVKPDYDVTFEKQYQLAQDVSVEPSTVQVSGPGVVIDTVSMIRTDKISLQNLSQSTVQEVKLLMPKAPNVNLSAEVAQVSFPVEKFTESTSQVKIDIINLPKGYKLKLFPEKVDIVYQLPLGRYEEAKAFKFKAHVDFDETKVESKKLSVIIDNAPDFVRAVRTVPETVEYIIQK